MKRISIIAIALMVVGSFVLTSCRGAVYTAPLVPRFTATAAALTLTAYTNATAQQTKITGSVTLTDTLGDTGYQALVNSVNLYSQSTNASDFQLAAVATANAPATGNGNVKTVKKSENKPANSVVLNFTATDVAYGTIATGTIAAYTNTGRWKNLVAKYNVTLQTEDGNTTVNIDELSKLESTWTVAIGNLP